MIALDTADLLSEITDFAQEILCRPVGDLNGRIERCRKLEERLEETVASRRLDNRYLDNFAPLLVTAIGRSLTQRHFCNEAAAAKWDCLIGHLIPQVRADGAAALETMREGQPERARG